MQSRRAGSAAEPELLDSDFRSPDNPPLRVQSPMTRQSRIWGPKAVPAVGGQTPGDYMSVFTILFIVLLLAWILGWGVFHVAGFLIHLLLIAAIIALILHFVRGASRTV